MQLVFIGDSLTLGVGDPQRRGWAGRVCERFDSSGRILTAYNLGIRASTTVHIAKRWKREVGDRISSDGASAIFCFGAADYANGLSYEQSMSAADAVLRESTNRFTTIFITPPPMIDESRDVKTAELASGFMKVCETLDIPYLNINYSLRNEPAYLDDIGNGDGVHPGSTGYEIMADQIYSFLHPLLSPRLA